MVSCRRRARQAAARAARGPWGGAREGAGRPRVHATNAERAGVHISQLGRYESGMNEPGLGVIAQLATALSTTADYLVFGDDPRLPDDERLRLAFEATTFLDDDERQTVLALLEAFLSRHDHRDGTEGPRRPRPKGT